MAKVQVLNVSVLDNPSPFRNPFQFEITFECMEDLPEGNYSPADGSPPGREDARGTSRVSAHQEDYISGGKTTNRCADHRPT